MSRRDTFKQTGLDKVISYFNPETGLRRMQARAKLSMAAGYKSGDRDRKAMRGWKLSGGSADAETLPHLDKLRSDSRDLMRNSALATGAINTLVTNAVGTGLRPQCTPDREFLLSKGVPEATIDAFEKAAEREFGWWANKDSDASRISTFADLQKLAFLSTLESGDVLVIHRMIRRKGRRLATALQLIEADRIANPGNRKDTAEQAAGVERDTFGAPIAYHVLQRHPGDNAASASRETDRIPAFYSNGQWQALHIFTRKRPQQTRGVPYLSPVIESLKQLERYSEAEIMAAVISSMFTVFVKTDTASGLGPMEMNSTQKEDEIRMGTGAIIDIGPEDEISFANPGRPNTAYGSFVQDILREIGSALEIPFELLIKHFTASYSASQAAFLEAWKFFRERRRWLTDNLCQPVWEAVISEAIASGYISAPGFFSDPAMRCAYLETEWIGPPRGMIDIRKEADANEIMERKGWKTNGEITAELTGGDWDRKQDRRAKERQKLVSAGLVEPRHENPTEQPPPDDDPDGQDKQEKEETE